MLVANLSVVRKVNVCTRDLNLSATLCTSYRSSTRQPDFLFLALPAVLKLPFLLRSELERARQLALLSLLRRNLHEIPLLLATML